ncbi:MAG TPA: hypothetical protein VIO38_02755, partial [Rariglobus sp.]
MVEDDMGARAGPIDPPVVDRAAAVRQEPPADLPLLVDDVVAPMEEPAAVATDHAATADQDAAPSVGTGSDESDSDDGSLDDDDSDYEGVTADGPNDDDDDGVSDLAAHVARTRLHDGDESGNDDDSDQEEDWLWITPRGPTSERLVLDRDLLSRAQAGTLTVA